MASRLTPALAALSAAAVLGGGGAAAAAPAPTAATTVTYTEATTGTVSPAPRAAPAAITPAAGSAPAARRPHGVRRLRPGAAQPATAAPLIGQAPAAAGASGGSLLENFNGVSSRDSEVTNFGQEFEPPDQGLCVGNGFVLEMVNSAYTVYDSSGNALAGPFNVNGPFDEGLVEFTSDPRCQYDAATNTWFATILAINPEETASTLDIAVNSSGDPRTPWTVYKVDTTGLGGTSGPHDRGCPCFGDQPTLGIDGVNLYVTTNEFSLAGEAFDGAQIYAFAKRALVAGSSNVHFVHFSKLHIDGQQAASVQPAITSGGATAEYFLSSLDASETFAQHIGVWALTNRAAVGRGELPTLSSVVIPSEVYGIPPFAKQKGAGATIETGDDRMQQTQLVGGSIWGELTTAVTLPGEAATRAGGAWFKVRPSLSGSLLSSARIEHQGYVTSPGGYVIYPALQVTPAGGAAMVFTLTSATLHPSAAYATLAAGEAAFGAPVLAAGGYTAYSPEGERWGDYSWAVLDPGASAVWLATEYVPPRSSQTTDGLHNWGTRVLKVAP